jgi:hypothetical protein
MAEKGMQVQSIRFGDQTWQDIQAEARIEGVSASQWIREAAVARVWFARMLRNEAADLEARARALAALEFARELEQH